MLIAIEKEEWDTMVSEIRGVKNALISNAFADAFTEWMDIDQAAKYLKMSKTYLHKLKDEKQITFSQYSKLIRFRRCDLDAFYESVSIKARN